VQGGPHGRQEDVLDRWSARSDEAATVTVASRRSGLVSALFLLTGLMSVLPKRAALWLSRIVAVLGILLIIALAISLRT